MIPSRIKHLQTRLHALEENAAQLQHSVGIWYRQEDNADHRAALDEVSAQLGKAVADLQKAYSASITG